MGYSTEDMIEDRKRALKSLRASVERYLGRITVLGIYNVSPGVMFALEHSWKGIKDCKEYLRKHGIRVSDEPNDDAPPEGSEMDIAIKDIIEKSRIQAIKEAHERSEAMRRERGYDDDDEDREPPPPPPPPKPPAPKAVNLKLFDLLNQVDEQKNPVDEHRADAGEDAVEAEEDKENRVDEDQPEKSKAEESELDASKLEESKRDGAG